MYERWFIARQTVQAVMTCKEEGNDQKSILSSTTPDAGHHMRKRQKHETTQDTIEPRGPPFPSR